MKRLFAVITASILVLSLASCVAKPDVENTTAPVAVTESQSAKYPAEKYLYNQSIALAVGMSGCDDIYMIDNENVFWNIIGYYCSYSHFNGGKDYLTEAQFDELQQLFRPGKPQFEYDSGKIGYITKDELSDGTVIFLFPTFTVNSNDFWNSLDFDITEKEYEITVKVNDSNNNSEETFVFEYDKSESGYPYLLKKMDLPDLKKQDGIPFTISELADSNRLENIFKNHENALVKEYIQGKNTMIDNVFEYKDNTIISEWRGDFYESDGFMFYYNDISLIKIDDYYTGRVCAGNSYECYDIASDYLISHLLDIGEISNFKDTGKTYTFDSVFVFTDMDTEFKNSYEINKNDLSLARAVLNAGSEYENEYIISYDTEIDDFGFTDGWDDNSYREIEVVFAYYENNELKTDKCIYSVPFNIELIPYTYEQYAIYPDENMTGEYNYPGNGVDYSICITNAMG